MCKKSESIAALAKALAAFQSEVVDPARDNDNPFFKSKYVALDGLMAAVRPVLSKHGLSIMQFPGGDGQTVSMVTLLLHESGEWVESDELRMRPTKADPQGVGSAVTYARRFSLQSILGVAWNEDDDANTASNPAQEPIRPATLPMAQPAPNDRQEKGRLKQELFAEATERGISTAEIAGIIQNFFRKKKFDELTLEEARKLRQNYEGFLHDLYKAQQDVA